MADLIDRAALVKEICNSCDGWCDNTNCDCTACKSEHRCEFVKELAGATAVDAVAVGDCAGCTYSNRKRPQKCSCCRRNPDMKDCYEEGG